MESKKELVSRQQLTIWLQKTEEFLLKNNVDSAIYKVIHHMRLTSGIVDCCVLDPSLLHVQYVRTACLLQQSRKYIESDDDIYVQNWIAKLEKAGKDIEFDAVASLQKKIAGDYFEMNGL